MSKKQIKALVEQVDESSAVFTASNESEDRDGDIIRVTAWDTNNFEKNPVILWGHRNDLPAIGKAKVWLEGAALKAKIMFDMGDEFAKNIARKVKDKIIQAVSVGFIPKEIDGEGAITKAELLEISVVNVPANAQALLDKSFKAAQKKFEMKAKAVIPYKKFPKASSDSEWSFSSSDGNKLLGEDKDNWEKFKSVHSWYDSNEPDKKTSYKLPIAKEVDGEVKVFLRGVQAAMGALLGARGGVEIPREDRKGVYNRLAKYYAEFDKTPPSFKEVSDEVEESKEEDTKKEEKKEAGDKKIKATESVKNMVRNAIDSCKQSAEVLEQVLKSTESVKDEKASSKNEVVVKLDAGEVRRRQATKIAYRALESVLYDLKHK